MLQVMCAQTQICDLLKDLKRVFTLNWKVDLPLWELL